jgi:hypothetical protein
MLTLLLQLRAQEALLQSEIVFSRVASVRHCLTSTQTQKGSFTPHPQLSAVKAASKRLSDAVAGVQHGTDVSAVVTAAAAKFQSNGKHAHTQLLLERHSYDDYVNIQYVAQHSSTSKAGKARTADRHTAVHALLKGLTGSRSVPGNMKMHTVVTK